MAPQTEGFRRPLLGVSRSTTAACCDALGLVPWDDPHNTERRFARARLRHDALPALVTALGPGVPQALARTARLLRDDDEALETWADEVAGRCRPAGDSEPGLDIVALGAAPPAVRRRVIRRSLLAAGATAGRLTAEQVGRVDDLVGAWKGQGPVALPGGIQARRCCGRLYLDPGQDAVSPDQQRAKE